MPRVEVRFDGVSRGARAASAETVSGIRAVGNEADRQGGRVSRFGSIVRTSIGLAAKAAAGGLVAMGGAVAFVGFKFDDMKQRARIAFTTMLGDGRKADVFLRQLQQFAARTPFELPGLIDASQRLLAMGFTSKQILPTLTAVGDAVAGLGGDPEKLNRVITALGQMQAKGRVAAEEMLQLTEAGIPAWQMLADKIGVSVPQAMKLVQNRAVASSVAIAAITQGMEKRFGGMMEKQSHTFSGLLSTLKDTFAQVSGSVMAPFFEMATRGMQRLVNITGSPEFTAGVKRFANELSQRVGRASTQTVATLRRHWGDIRSAIGLAWDTLRLGARIFVAVARASNTVAHAIGGWRPFLISLAAGFAAAKIAMMTFMLTTRIQAMLTAGTIKTALISTGVGALIVAVGLAATLVIQHFGRIKAAVIGVAQSIRHTFNSVWKWLVEAALKTALKVIEPFSHLPGGLGAWARRAKNRLNQELRDMQHDAGEYGKAIGEAVGKQIYDAANPWMAKLGQSLFDAITQGIAAGQPVSEHGAGQAGSGGPTTPSKLGRGIVGTAMSAARSPGHASTRFHLPGEASPYDCSAFAQAVFAHNGIHIGRDTYAQFGSGRKVERNDIQPGDLVFFNYPGERSPGHVGIAVGGGMMVHDHGASRGVDYQGIDWHAYVGARCYIKGHVHGRKTGGGGGKPPPTAAPTDALFGVDDSDLTTTKKGPRKGKQGLAKAALITIRAAIDDDLRELANLKPTVAKHLSDLAREAARHLRALRAHLHVGMSAADLATTKAGIRRWSKVLSDEIGKAKEAARKEAEEAAEAMQRALDRKFAHANRIVQRDFDRQSQTYIDSFNKATQARVATMQKAFDRQMRGIREAFQDQMEAFDRETQRGLRGFEIAQTPEEAALSQFDAARQAEEDAKRIAEAGGDPEQLRQIELEMQRRALEERARTSREAADAATQDAQESYQRQRDLQRRALEDQESDYEDALQERFNADVAAFEEMRARELQEWQDRRDDQQEQLNNDLEDWQIWINAKKKTWADFLRWLAGNGFDLPDGMLQQPDEVVAERLFDVGVRPRGSAGGAVPAAHGGRVPGSYVGYEDTVLMRAATPGERYISRDQERWLDNLAASMTGAGGRGGPIYVLGTTPREVARALASLTGPESARRIFYPSPPV